MTKSEIANELFNAVAGNRQSMYNMGYLCTEFAKNVINNPDVFPNTDTAANGLISVARLWNDLSEKEGKTDYGLIVEARDLTLDVFKNELLIDLAEGY